MTDRTILAVVGSSTFVCPKGLAIALNQINVVVDMIRPDEIVSGCSPKGGVDLLAEQVARTRGLPFKGFPPRVNRWAGNGGYQWRNHLVADRCTMLLRIACAHSKTWGSGYTAMITRKDGKPVQEFWIYEDGRVTDVEPKRSRTSRPAPASWQPPAGELRTVPAAPPRPGIMRVAVETPPEPELVEQLALDVTTTQPRRSEVDRPAMTAPLAAAARVTTRCETCGGLFEQPIDRMLAGKPYKWCGDECFQASRATWAAENTGPACKVCAGPVSVARDSYGLPICGVCRNLAYNSCWKKRVYTSGFQAMRWIRRYKEEGMTGELSPYKCSLCGGRWHATSGGTDEPLGQACADDLLALAALFEELGFDIDCARGYTVQPDGSHLPVPTSK